MNVQLQAPDKTIKGQLGWLRKQLSDCQVKDPENFAQVKSELFINSLLKYKNDYPAFQISQIDEAIEELKGKEITGFVVSQIKHLGASFDSPKNFVRIIEEMLIDFYEAVVQYLSNPPKKIPKIQPQEPVQEEEIVSQDA